MDLLSAIAANIWSYGVVFLGVLTAVVFIHELGHFLVARWCGVTVTTFSIGFGPELFGFNDKHGTRWRFAAVPLGGYVKFSDDDNAASVPSAEAQARMTPEQRAGSFHAKPVWQRAAVVAAGPIANFILAIIIYAIVNMTVGVRTTVARIDEVTPGKPAAAAGMQAGDVITAINGWSIESFDEVVRKVASEPDLPLAFTLDRAGRTVNVTVTPVGTSIPDGFGGSYRIGDIGIASRTPAIIGMVTPGLPAERAGFKSGDVVTAIDGVPVKWFEDLVRIVSKATDKELVFDIVRDGKPLQLRAIPVPRVQKDAQGNVTERRPIIGVGRTGPEPVAVGPVEAVRLGVRETWATITSTVGGISAIVSGRQSADQMGGPVMMAEVTAKVSELGVEALLKWIAFVSANIGFLNLLPIPVLDGGHLLFYAIEAIRRKPLNERFQEVGFRIGIALVLMLMIYVNLNDLMRVWRRVIGVG